MLCKRCESCCGLCFGGYVIKNFIKRQGKQLRGIEGYREMIGR